MSPKDEIGTVKTISDKEVLEIFDIAHRGTMTYREICNTYNISVATVSGIANKKTRLSVLNPAGIKPHIKLSEADVLDIYNKARHGLNNEAIIKIYPVSCSTITNIKYGRRWAWLTEPEGFKKEKKRTSKHRGE
jgi:hypothetical protein